MLFCLIAIGACAPVDRVVVTPSMQAPDYERAAPFIEQHMAQPAILLFSKTRSYRHDEGIAGADRYFAEAAGDRSMGLFTTANGAVFNDAQLTRFSLVVFNNVTGDVLSPEQRAAFQRWIEAGGGLIAVHGSGDASHKGWEWYDRELIGPEFIGHPAAPQFQSARLVNLAASHPVMRGLPAQWQHTDEWYSFDHAAKIGDARVLIGIDEDSYSPRNDVYGDVADLRMGGGPAGHPIAWLRCAGKGRVFYSAMGHSFTAYDAPENRLLLSNVIDWATRKTSAMSEAC